MAKYPVYEPLLGDRPTPYMPGDIVEMDEKEARGLIKAGVLGESDELGGGRGLNATKTIELAKAATTNAELDELALGETRKTVLMAIETRRFDLEE